MAYINGIVLLAGLAATGPEAERIDGIYQMAGLDSEGVPRLLVLAADGTLGDTIFQAAGAGAVVRTIQDKAREVVSVGDFGAVGDGVVDDTAAFVAALATGKDVYVPTGTYIITSQITVNGQHLYGTGSKSILRTLVATFNIINMTGTSPRVSDLQFQGAATSNVTNQYAIYGSVASPPINPSVVRNKFSGPSALGGLNNGIKFDTGTTDVEVIDNYFERIIGIDGGAGYGVLLGAVTRFNVSNNTFIGSRVNSQGRHAVYPGGGATYGLIANNTVVQFSFEALTVNHYSGQNTNDYIEITNNIISQCGGDYTSGGSISVFGTCDNILIADNQIDESFGPGIMVTPTNTGGICGAIKVTIDGNIITDSNYWGIICEGVKHLLVENNHISGSSRKTAQVYADIRVDSYGSPANTLTISIHGNKCIAVAGSSRSAIQVVGSTPLIALLKFWANDFPTTDYLFAPEYNLSLGIPTWFEGFPIPGVNTVLASNGVTTLPNYRALVATDIPTTLRATTAPGVTITASVGATQLVIDDLDNAYLGDQLRIGNVSSAAYYKLGRDGSGYLALTPTQDNANGYQFYLKTGGATASVLLLTSAGGLFAVPVITILSAAGGAGLRVPHGVAPSNPVDGDIWTTTAGMFVRINGVTKTVTLS